MLFRFVHKLKASTSCTSRGTRCLKCLAGCRNGQCMKVITADSEDKQQVVRVDYSRLLISGRLVKRNSALSGTVSSYQSKLPL